MLSHEAARLSYVLGCVDLGILRCQLLQQRFRQDLPLHAEHIWRAQLSLAEFNQFPACLTHASFSPLSVYEPLSSVPMPIKSV